MPRTDTSQSDAQTHVSSVSVIMRPSFSSLLTPASTEGASGPCTACRTFSDEGGHRRIRRNRHSPRWVLLQGIQDPSCEGSSDLAVVLLQMSPAFIRESLAFAQGRLLRCDTALGSLAANGVAPPVPIDGCRDGDTFAGFDPAEPLTISRAALLATLLHGL
jgi:hypothetical protein